MNRCHTMERILGRDADLVWSRGGSLDRQRCGLGDELVPHAMKKGEVDWIDRFGPCLVDFEGAWIDGGAVWEMNSCLTQ